MPPKRSSKGSDNDEIVVLPAEPAKRVRKELAIPRTTDWRNHIIYHISVAGQVSYGHLKEEISARLEQQELHNRKPSIPARHGIMCCYDDVQEHVDLYKLPLIFAHIITSPEKRDGSTYMDHTRGKTMPGLEDCFRARTLEVYEGRGASVWIDALEKTKEVREKDNLFHIHALFAHMTVDPQNEEGLMITTGQIDTLCALLEAEGAFGLPQFYGDPQTQYARHSKLDLSHIITDLIDALRRQRLYGTFARPLTWSRACDDGNQNPVATKPGHRNLYVIINSEFIF